MIRELIGLSKMDTEHNHPHEAVIADAFEKVLRDPVAFMVATEQVIQNLDTLDPDSVTIGVCAGMSMMLMNMKALKQAENQKTTEVELACPVAWLTQVSEYLNNKRRTHHKGPGTLQ